MNLRVSLSIFTAHILMSMKYNTLLTNQELANIFGRPYAMLFVILFVSRYGVRAHIGSTRILVTTSVSKAGLPLAL